MVKKCKKCGKLLPIEEYYTYPNTKDGHLNVCKQCVKERVRNHRLKFIDKFREYDRTRGVSGKRRESSTNSTKRKRRELIGYQKSHNAVHRAIEKGDISRLMYCQVCGKICKTEAHHNDYSRPLDVIWLCSDCHSQYHTGKTLFSEEIREAVNRIFDEAYA